MKLIENILSIVSKPITFVDIGARNGVHARWVEIIDKLPVNIIGFEPDKKECDKLNKHAKTSEQFLPYAVSSEKGRKTFYITESTGNYSLFEPDNQYINRFVPRDSYKVNHTLQVDVVSLDSAMNISHIEDIDFVKIDTEGGELDILNGAEESMKQVFGVELEVWFNRINKGAPLFSDIDRKMRELGFTLFDVARDNFVKRINGKNLGGPKGQLWSGDMLYFRDIPYLVNNKSIFLTTDKIIKSIIILMVYSYYDYALEIIEDHHVRNLFSDSESAEIVRFIKRNGKRIPYFKGRYRLTKFIQRLSRKISMHEADFLGNW